LPELTLRVAQRTQVLLLARGKNAGARAHDGVQGLLFMAHVLLAGLHQLGQFVVPLLQQHIDIGPGLGGFMLEVDQPVVDQNDVTDGDDQKSQHNEDGDDHGGILQRVNNGPGM